MTDIDAKIEQLNMENSDIETTIEGLKSTLYANKKKIKNLEESKQLLEE